MTFFFVFLTQNPKIMYGPKHMDSCLMLPGVQEQYHLIASIDSRAGHFTNRFIYRNQECFYDGMHTVGSLRTGLSHSIRTLTDGYTMGWKDSKLNGEYHELPVQSYL